ncbi:MAG TPA: SHOCT domain-containing protein [Candidatus Limnocylindrales bacterium]|jgi:uncharacterized membrane protein
MDMRAVWIRRLFWLVVALVVVGVVAGLAYSIGISNSHGTTSMPMRPFGRGFVGDGYAWPGIGLFGFAALVLFVLLLVWLIGSAFSGPARDVGGSRPPEAGSSVERLRELSDMHSNGQLTDEEFAAAKRKLLGL